MRKHILSLLLLLMPMIGMAATHDYVDLGLPSATMWATCNVGANTPEEYGSYFAWGEIEPKNSYSWKNYKLCSKGTSASVYDPTVEQDGYMGWGFSSYPSYDAANKNWGGLWKTPTIYQIKELLCFCTATTVTQKGVKGVKFTGPNGKSIFMPFAGYKYDSKYLGVGSETYYWSANYDKDNKAKAQTLCLGGSSPTADKLCWRRTGLPIRPVMMNKLEYVDLGLSKQWATCNVGATSPEQPGRFYAWGENFPKAKYTWANYVGEYDELNYILTNPAYMIGKLFRTSLDDYDWGIAEEDYADVYYEYDIDSGEFIIEYPVGGGYEDGMPEESDIEELILRCKWKETTMNGVKGYQVTGPNGNSIFLPFGGCSYDGKDVGKGTDAYYWSGTIDPSNNQKAKALYVKSGMKEIKSAQLRTGIMIRPVKERIRPVIMEDELVDLGLSVKWASSNIYGWSTRYGKEEARNYYYAWGENDVKENYTWKNYQYANGTSSSCVFIGEDISETKYDCVRYSENEFYDADINDLNFDLRMPTVQEFQELMDKCTFKVDYLKYEGVFQKGFLVTGPNGKSIFMPFAGCSYEGKDYGEDTYAYYWTSNYDPKYKYKAKAAYLSENEKKITSAQRRTGCLVRPVADLIRYVDLGLPSGNLWAKNNLGTDEPYANGCYYAWGETSEKTDYTWKNYLWANGTASSVKDIGDCISYFGDFYHDENCENPTPGSCWDFIWFDPCVEVLENLYIFDDFSGKEITYYGMMPSKEDFEELLANCTIEEDTKLVKSIIVVKGLSFIGPNGSSIFFPYAHSCYDGKGPTSGTSSYYWTGDLSNDKKKAYALSVNNGSAAITTCQRRTGLPIRPVYVKMDDGEAYSTKFVADGINNVRKRATVEKNAIYTLQGMKVEGNLKPSVYIRNGKKFVVK